jgi:hypothetical protein
MNPSWPKRIDSGHGWVTSRNADKTGFPKGKIERRFWPGERQPKQSEPASMLAFPLSIGRRCPCQTPLAGVCCTTQLDRRHAGTGLYPSDWQAGHDEEMNEMIAKGWAGLLTFED